MKIGVGVTTRNRPDVFSFAMDRHHACASKSMQYVVVDDASRDSVSVRPHVQLIRNEERLGIAKSKNKCIAALKDCDYIFLFDDDAYPDAHDWYERYIETHLATGIHHLMHLKETGSVVKIADYTINDVTVYQYSACGGVMLFLTKEVLKKVGGYNSAYEFYGYEHAGYTHRIHRAELTAGLTPYLGIPNSPIYSFDWDGIPYGPNVVWRSSVTAEEAVELSTRNAKIFQQECSGVIYMPFE